MAETTLIVTTHPNPEAMDSVKAYLGGVQPLLVEAGGQIVKRLQVQDVMSGDAPYRMVLVMDFADDGALKAMLRSDAYQALVPHRDRGFASMDICLASGM